MGETPEPTPEPTLEPTYAIVLSGGKLFKDYGNNKRETLAEVTGAKECYADSMHQVVWTLGPKGVATFDAVDGRHRAVVPTDIQIDRFAVQAFPDPRAPYPSMAAGNFDEWSDCVALVVLINADPTVSGHASDDDEICEYNMEDMTLAPEHKAEVERYNNIRTFDIAYFKELEVRRRDTWKEPETATKNAAKAPVVSVDKSPCTDAREDCGKVSFVGGRFWSVVTANGRGDLPWERRHLYDATTQEFFRPQDGTRSAKPLGSPIDVEGMQISPDKVWAKLHGKRLSLTTGVLMDASEGVFCGWGPL